MSHDLEMLLVLLASYGWRERDGVLVSDGGHVTISAPMVIEFCDPNTGDPAYLAITRGWSYGTVVHLAMQVELMVRVARTAQAG